MHTAMLKVSEGNTKVHDAEINQKIFIIFFKFYLFHKCIDIHLRTYIKINV